MTQKKSSTRKSKKGGTFELAPLVATGALYGTALYAKKNGRRMRGGADVVVSSPGGAVPVINAGKPEMPSKVEPAVGGKAVPAIELVPTDVRRESPAAAVTGSAANSPLVAGMLDLSKNDYLGGVAGSRAASVSAPGGLLEGGGKKKRRTRKYKGGESCQAMAASIPTNAGAGGDIRGSLVVSGAVGGVSAQEEPGSMEGGARRRRKGKKRGGEGCGMVQMDGGARRRRKGKKRGGAEEGGSEVGGDMEMGDEGDYSEGGMEGGARRRRKGKGKKRGGNPDMAESGEGVDVLAEGDDMEEGGMEGGARRRRKNKKRGGDGGCGMVAMDGGAKKRKSKKRGGAEGGDMEEGGSEEGGSVEDDIAEMKGGAKKRKGKGKKHGGTELTPEEAEAAGWLHENKFTINNLLSGPKKTALIQLRNKLNDKVTLNMYSNHEINTGAYKLAKAQQEQYQSSRGLTRVSAFPRHTAYYDNFDPGMATRDQEEYRQYIEEEPMAGGAKKRKGKKRGGADVPEAFDAGADKAAPAMGGFDNLLADLKQQVGGKYNKKRGGAFKLYAKELESLSKKLKKLM